MADRYGHPVPDGGPSYCSNCGEAVEPDDSYCSDCGHQLVGAADAADASDDPSEQSLEEFRRRVSDYVANDWDIEYDAGDEVVLVDRGVGSIAVHALLLMFTGGVGNLLYGWYHYSYTAEKKVLRADGTERMPGEDPAPPQGYEGDESGSLGAFAAGLGLFIAGIAVLVSAGFSAVPIMVGLALLVLGLRVFPPTYRRIQDRHPPTTFGPTQSVEEHVISDTNEACSVCLDRVEKGVRREYTEEYVVAGLPLYTIEAGENWYCESCRHGHPETGVDPIADIDAERSTAGDEGTDDTDSDRSAGTDSNESAPEMGSVGAGNDLNENLSEETS
ncbi:hypothetical protein BRC87_01135 [Halobacteriales archaeon QS_4_66_20]|nr:MAG: hypothetical protein BRC87_01135 [Halobacteriales archaeon QS_4_66_20]